MAKWTLGKVRAEAKKYQTRGEFSKGSPGAYGAAYRNGWLDDLNLPSSKWTKDAVFEEAKLYSSRSTFSKGSHSAYLVARKKDWLKELFPQDLRRRPHK